MSICFLLEISPESVENCLTVACLQCSATTLKTGGILGPRVFAGFHIPRGIIMEGGPDGSTRTPGFA